MESRAEGDAPTGHDHAWSRVKKTHDYGVDDEYRCDICDLAWSLPLFDSGTVTDP